MSKEPQNRREVLEMLTTNECPACGGGVGFIAYSMGYCNWCLADLPTPPPPLDKYVAAPPSVGSGGSAGAEQSPQGVSKP